jgi:hypothetical protein
LLRGTLAGRLKSTNAGQEIEGHIFKDLPDLSALSFHGPPKNTAG